MIELKVEGLKELQDQLLQLDRKLAVKVLAKAARQAFKPVLLDARRMAPVDTGLLRQRLRMQVEKVKSGDSVVRVGLRLGKKPFRMKKKVKREARNWAWYEHGVPSRGIAPHPFLRPALDKNAQAVVSALRTELGKAIEQAVSETKKR